MKTGECVGATKESLEDFEKGNMDTNTKRGLNLATRGKLQVNINVKRKETISESNKDSHAHTETRKITPLDNRKAKLLQVGNEIFLLEEIMRR